MAFSRPSSGAGSLVTAMPKSSACSLKATNDSFMLAVHFFDRCSMPSDTSSDSSVRSSAPAFSTVPMNFAARGDGSTSTTMMPSEAAGVAGAGTGAAGGSADETGSLSLSVAAAFTGGSVITGSSGSSSAGSGSFEKPIAASSSSSSAVVGSAAGSSLCFFLPLPMAGLNSIQPDWML